MDVTLESFQASIADVKPDDVVVFNISSPGGSVLTGFEIYNEVKNLKASKKIFQINGMAASIASIIVMAGDEIEASEFSLFMIHQASAGADGNATQLAQQIEILDKIDTLLLDTYHERNNNKGKKKISREAISDMLSAETWLTPAEALEYGFIDRIVNKLSDITKIAAKANTNLTMDYLQKLRKVLAQGGKVELTLEDVKNAVTQALEGKTFSSLKDEEVDGFLVAVKALLQAKTGGTLAEDQEAQVNEFLNTIVDELKASELSNTSDGKIEALKQSIDRLAALVDTIAKSSVETGQQVENLTTDLTALKKNIRSFGKKPFTNETSRLNLGSAYVDPWAKHRSQMEEIDKKTRK